MLRLRSSIAPNALRPIGPIEPHLCIGYAPVPLINILFLGPIYCFSRPVLRSFCPKRGLRHITLRAIYPKYIITLCMGPFTLVPQTSYRPVLPYYMPQCLTFYSILQHYVMLFHTVPYYSILSDYAIIRVFFIYGIVWHTIPY